MLHQAFIRNAAAIELAKDREIVVFDSWTANDKLRRFTRGDRRAKRQESPVSSNYLGRMHDLLTEPAKMDLRGLAEELSYTNKVILKNPTIRIRTRRDVEPNMDGTITIAKTGPQTLIVTVRNYEDLPGAISLQFRGDKKLGLLPGKTIVRAVACYGPEMGISYGLSAIQTLLSHDYNLQTAIEKARRTGGVRTPELDALNLAGMRGSSERMLYEKLLEHGTPGIRRQPCWVLPELKAC